MPLQPATAGRPVPIRSRGRNTSFALRAGTHQDQPEAPITPGRKPSIRASDLSMRSSTTETAASFSGRAPARAGHGTTDRSLRDV